MLTEIITVLKTIKEIKDLLKLVLMLVLPELLLVIEFLELLKEHVMEDYLSLIQLEDSQEINRELKEKNSMLNNIEIEFLELMLINIWFH